jgi:hypothetical protein
MTLQSAKRVLLWLVLSAVGAARAQQVQPTVADRPVDDATGAEVQDRSAPGSESAPREPSTALASDNDSARRDPWLDRTQRGLHQAVWRSAMRIDRVFGAEADESAYQKASGSLAPALLWDEFDGFQPKVRFRVNLPLPQLDERFNAFIGRVNRDEYVTERQLESGAFPRQYGPIEDDQTLFGIRYREPRQGGRFEADAGLRVRTPLDPYVKASYRFERGASERTLLSLRETAFWQNSEEFGLTSRIDIERIFENRWLLRWTGSGTFSQETEGVRGYTALSVLRGFPNRRAIAAELFTGGELDADVPLGNYGAKIAYRRSVSRDWLILEMRSSLTWPKEHPEQPREPSWGVGIGFEMFFGTDEFLARPVTF